MLDLQYQLQAGEAGVFAEIYLPKRVHYQGVLYKSLKGGFSIQTVKSHFRRNQKSIEKFIEKAKAYWDVRGDGALPINFRLSKSIINRFPDLYYGYSMYEVDGVFRSQTSNEKVKLVEERTQVIRIMFKLDLKSQFQEIFPTSKQKRDSAELLTRAYLRSYHWKKEGFILDYSVLPSAGLTDEEIAHIIDVAAEWSRFIGIFLFGYILYTICKEIEGLHANEQIRLEEEIWVTFFWNLIITRVKKRK